MRDHDADRRNGIRTTAVACGPRRAMLASLVVFSAAYGQLVTLAALGVVPRPLLWVAALLWPLHLVWSLRALRGEPVTDQARWLQRRYRLLFAIVGAAMVLAVMAQSAWRDRRAPAAAVEVHSPPAPAPLRPG